jgi:hypothetical protein
MELNDNILSRQVFFYSVIISIIVLFYVSCTDDPLESGFKKWMGSDTLQIDTLILPVQLYTISTNPFNSRAISQSPLGSLYDPLFGKLKADFVTNLMYGEEISFREDFSPDSIEIYNLELQLHYDSIYGDEKEVDFKVYELIKDIPDYSKSDFEVTNDMINVSPISIGKPVKLNDTTKIYTITLSKDYAEKFIDSTLINDSAYYYNNYNYRKFRDAIKGLYISTSYRTTEGGGIVTVSHVTSRLILSTIETTRSGKIDTNTYEFVLATPELKETLHINMYQNINSETINAVLDDTVNIHPLTYMQGLSGPRLLVKFPTLKEKRIEFDYKVVINKAELILHVDSSNTDLEFYKVPVYLAVKDVSTDSTIIDAGLISGYLGGKINPLKFEYRLNIGNYIHGFFQDATGTEFSDELFLSAVDNYYGRVVFNNTNTSAPPLLRIVYSILPE